MTYDATIRTPKELVAVMAAESEERRARGVFQFTMPQPIPSYLIALAVGDLAYQRHEQPHGRLGGAVDGGRGGARVRATPEKMIEATEAVRPVSLGPVRPARAAAVVSIRRHGESAAHVRDADHHRRRQVAGLARGARAGAFVVGQSRHERHMVGLLAERRLHHLPRASHCRSRLRQAARRNGSDDWRRRTRGRPQRRSRSRATGRCCPT